MAHKKGPEALHKTLQHLNNNKYIMGKVVVILAGDFRQTLPVITHGTTADQIDACLKKSYLWKYTKIIMLKKNMRVFLTGDPTLSTFSEQLLLLGNGKWKEDSDGTVEFPSNFCNIVKSIESLKTHVFPDMQKNYINHEWICERAILAPTNNKVDDINKDILNSLPGESKIYKSIDSVCNPEDSIHYPMEFLNSSTIPGLPPHILTLKIGAPIMILRNINPPKLCNGTRLSVKSLKNNVIEATILTGCGKGEVVYIPRIPIKPSDVPFGFERLQFPVKLAFTFTINKSQG
ncbi:ATP-dependent DNA helicase PIF1-like [Acyrthosiphon pisum]|uniref:ATP-dependent DNA helicase n=1 Tax=Acyrthosiphon pisum TaxID=7029 RepID=A0A8R2NMV6_ACYPI|nr:ATP-dependent DNA helicase PIF1-like [Acyrthosiphon pisum]